MKGLLVFILLLTTQVSFALETVPFVDVSRYLGRWYQMGRKPLIFEPRFCACAQQTLADQGDGTVSVYNSCNRGTPEGRLVDIRGFAEVIDETTNAKLSVDFGLPWKGSYWIIGLDEDYQWAVVSDKRENSLYLLSKTPNFSEETYQEALDSVRGKISLEGIIRTEHQGCQYPN